MGFADCGCMDTWRAQDIMEERNPISNSNNNGGSPALSSSSNSNSSSCLSSSSNSSSTQLLRSAEALTMPGVQVIVLSANMRCQECRDRVSKVLSKMDSLLDYVVDVTQKKVTIRGRVDPKKRIQRRLNNLKYERLAANKSFTHSALRQKQTQQQTSRCGILSKAASYLSCS